MKKIDVHLHVGSGNPIVDDGVKCTGQSVDPTYLLKQMDTYEVEQAVILGMDIPGSFVSNEYVSELQKKYPKRFIGCACINPMRHWDNGVWQMKRCIKKLGFRALKLMPPYQFFHINDKRMYGLYRLLEKNGIVLIVHTGTTDWPTAKLEYCRPLEIDTVATDFPNLKILMAHSGDPWFGETRDILYKNKNVYADFSGVILGTDPNRGIANLHKFFDDYLSQFPLDRLCFGTDYPFTKFSDYEKAITTYKVSSKLLKSNKLTKKQLWEQLLYKNAKKLFSPIK